MENEFKSHARAMIFAVALNLTGIIGTLILLALKLDDQSAFSWFEVALPFAIGGVLALIVAAGSFYLFVTKD